MDAVNKFSSLLANRMEKLEIPMPNLNVLRTIVRNVHTASMITEEGRFILASVTLANPSTPDLTPPRLCRADYPQFTSFDEPLPFTAESLAKLARAVDKWSGSIVIWGDTPKHIYVWGIVDQIVGASVHLHRESSGGFAYPGNLTLIVDRPGDMTAYCAEIFMGSLRAQQILLAEAEAFDSAMLQERLVPAFAPRAASISATLTKAGASDDTDEIISRLLGSWQDSIARICIGLRRLGTGGSLLITNAPAGGVLAITRKFKYERLSAALTLQVLDRTYNHHLHWSLIEESSISREELVELNFSETDAKDRDDEVNGAIKIITSLAALDGALLLTPTLEVIGFGVKIGSGDDPKVVYDGEDFANRGSNAKKVDTTRFGTRHGSVLRYCSTDPSALGIIVSQDGHVRIALQVNGHMVLWDRVQLLNHRNFTDEEVAESIRYRKKASKRKKSERYGYSKMPKNLSDLSTETLQ